MFNKDKTALYEISAVFAGLMILSIIIAIHELVSGLSYAKIMLLLVSIVFLFFSIQVRRTVFAEK